MVSKVITGEVLAALQAWKKEENLTCEGIGKLCGVDKSSVSSWFNGVSRKIRKSTWDNLFPHIEKYLPKDFSVSANNSAVIVNNGGVNNGNAVSGHYFSIIINKILNSEKLTAEEKLKMIAVLNEE